MSEYRGKCHCGDLGFVYRTGVDPKDWPIRACQCTFCRRHGALSTSDPRGAIDFRITRPESLIRYRFGRRTADFLICARCGTYVAACMESPRGRYAVLNVNVLEPRPADLAQPTPMNYEGETPEDRAARREERWTPVVSAT
jgi:hypothetical protein